jgi:hypothetical protein
MLFNHHDIINMEILCHRSREGERVRERERERERGERDRQRFVVPMRYNRQFGSSLELDLRVSGILV